MQPVELVIFNPENVMQSPILNLVMQTKEASKMPIADPVVSQLWTAEAVLD